MSELVTVVVLLALAAPAALPAAFLWNRALVKFSRRLLARGRFRKAALVASTR